MGGKVKVGGTAYDVSPGKVKVGGTAYSILYGKTKIGGTAHTISFSPIPSEYQEVEYITGSGTQYIRLPIDSDDNLKLEFEVKGLDSDGYFCAIGAYSSTAKNQYFMIQDTGSARKYYAYMTNRLVQTSVSADYHDSTNIHTVYVDFASYANKPSITVDGVTTTATSNVTTDHEIGRPMYLFSRGTNTTGRGKGSFGKVKAYRVVGGTVLMDLYPCYRKSDNVVGMYDLISETFLENIGTGSFTAGPTV